MIPQSGRSPGGGNGNPLQYSCLENPGDRGAWWATVHTVAKSDMTEQLRTAQKSKAEFTLTLPLNWDIDYPSFKLKPRLELIQSGLPVLRPSDLN